MRFVRTVPTLMLTTHELWTSELKAECQQGADSGCRGEGALGGEWLRFIGDRFFGSRGRGACGFFGGGEELAEVGGDPPDQLDHSLVLSCVVGMGSRSEWLGVWRSSGALGRSPLWGMEGGRAFGGWVGARTEQ